MAVVPPGTLKTYFENGDIPTQTEFGDFIDSMVHVSQVGNVTDKALLIVMLGDDNSEGRGNNLGLHSDFLKPSKQVQIWNPTNSAFEDLEIGVNNMFDSAPVVNWQDKHGLEAELLNSGSGIFGVNKIHIVKCGHGGSRIADWGLTDPNYTDSIDRINDAVTALTNQSLTVDVLCWINIGVNDVIAGNFAATYKTGLTTLISDLRTSLTRPSMPVAIGHLPLFSGFPSSSTYNTEIDAVADADPYTISIETSEAETNDGETMFSVYGLRSVSYDFAKASVIEFDLNQNTFSPRAGNYTKFDSLKTYHGEFASDMLSDIGVYYIDTKIPIPTNSGGYLLAFELDLFNLHRVISKVKIGVYINSVNGIDSVIYNHSSDSDIRVRAANSSGTLEFILGELDSNLQYTHINAKLLSAYDTAGKKFFVELSEKFNISILKNITNISNIEEGKFLGLAKPFVATYNSISQITGALVIRTNYDKDALDSRYLYLRVNIFDKDEAFYIESGVYNTGNNTPNHGSAKTSKALSAIPVQWGFDATNKLCFIIGTVTDVWETPNLSAELLVGAADSGSGEDIRLNKYHNWDTYHTTNLGGITDALQLVAVSELPEPPSNPGTYNLQIVVPGNSLQWV